MHEGGGVNEIVVGIDGGGPKLIIVGTDTGPNAITDGIEHPPCI